MPRVPQPMVAPRTNDSGRCERANRMPARECAYSETGACVRAQPSIQLEEDPTGHFCDHGTARTDDEVVAVRRSPSAVCRRQLDLVSPDVGARGWLAFVSWATIRRIYDIARAALWALAVAMVVNMIIHSPQISEARRREER